MTPEEEEELEYLTLKGKGAGQTTQTPPIQAGPSVAESALRGASQGATLGFGDEMWGGARAIGEALPESLGGEPKNGKGMGENLLSSYRKNRDQMRADNAKAEAENPKAYFGGSMAGGLATAPLGGARLGAPLAALAKSGAILGGAAGLGFSGADLTKGDVQGAATDTATGAAAGAALANLGDEATKLPAIFAKLGDKVANNRALAAAGAMLKHLRKMGYKGTTEDAAKELFDSGALKGLAPDVESIAKKVAAEHGSVGKQIGDVTSKLKGSFDANAAADRIEKELIEPLRQQPAYAGSGIPEQLKGQTELLRQMTPEAGAGRVSFKDAIGIKGGYDDFLKNSYGKESTPATEAMKSFRGILKDEIMNQVDGVSDAVTAEHPNATLGQKLKELNRRYGLLSDLKEMSSDRAFREQSHMPLGIMEGMGGLGGVLASNMEGSHGTPGAVVGGVASALGTHLTKKYGAALAARAARAAVTPARRVGQAIAETPAVPSIGAILASTAGRSARGGAAP